MEEKQDAQQNDLKWLEKIPRAERWLVGKRKVVGKRRKGSCELENLKLHLMHLGWRLWKVAFANRSSVRLLTSRPKLMSNDYLLSWWRFRKIYDNTLFHSLVEKIRCIINNTKKFKKRSRTISTAFEKFVIYNRQLVSWYVVGKLFSSLGYFVVYEIH